MSDNIEAKKVVCRFEKDEIVEYYDKNTWRPAKVLSINNLIVKQKIQKADSDVESLCFIIIECAHKQVNVLQTSTYLQITNTNIHEYIGTTKKKNPNYERMLEMMSHEKKKIRHKRVKRVQCRLAAVHAINKSIQQFDPNRDTSFARLQLAGFIRGIRPDCNTIRTSGEKKEKKKKKKKRTLKESEALKKRTLKESETLRQTLVF